MQPSDAAPAGIPVTIIKDGAIVHPDRWLALDDAAPVPAEGAIVVSLGRFERERPALLARAGALAVTLEAGDGPERLGPDFAKLAAIFIRFPSFRDGRGYSSARLLRERFGFRGEIRAIGDVLRDQLFLMRRAGFDAFALKDRDPLGALAWALANFSVVYQPGADHAMPAFARRARAKADI